MDDAVAKPDSPLNVLTAADKARRLAMFGINALGLGLMATLIAPYAAANTALFIGTAIAYTMVRVNRKIFTRYNEPTDRHDQCRDVPEHAKRAVTHFAELAGIRLPDVIRLEAPNTLAQATANVGYTTAYVGFTTALEREYDKLAFTAFLAHEVGHISHDDQKLDATNAMMLFSGRTLR